MSKNNNNNCGTIEVKNQKVEVPTGISLNDKDYLEGLLTVCKELEKNLTVAMTEAGNESLYEEIFDMFTEIADLQRDVYETLFRKGWFVVCVEDNNRIMKKYNELNQEFLDLGVEEN